MKTIKDIQEMKDFDSPRFNNAYDLLITAMSNYYIRKFDGIELVKHELRGWDTESRQIIVNDMIDKITDLELEGFDTKELLKLIE